MDTLTTTSLRVLMTLALAVLAGLALAGTAHARPACSTEDSATWTWTRCGNHTRGVILYTGKHATVTCRGLRAGLERSVISELRTPWLRGDYSCGRRH